MKKQKELLGAPSSVPGKLRWCERRDLNPYGGTTRPSNVRVCQFRHSRLLLSLWTCFIIIYTYGKVNTLLEKFWQFDAFPLCLPPIKNHIKLTFFFFLIYNDNRVRPTRPYLLRHCRGSRTHRLRTAESTAVLAAARRKMPRFCTVCL